MFPETRSPSTFAPAEEGRSAATGRTTAPRGHIGIYAALGASVGTVPLPWIPEALMRRVRGAMSRELASRYGLTLSVEAREALSESTREADAGTALHRVLRFFGVRVLVRVLTRFGPVWVVWPLRNALATFAMGHLFERYVAVRRTERGTRIDVDEARRVRRAVDGAVARAVFVKTPKTEPSEAIDDERDRTTAFFDGLIGWAAELPDVLVQRLDTAFDELLATSHD